MLRNDLLALTPDDLASLTNRGIVKRALRELEAGEPSYEIAEEADELVVRWSDQIVCRFPAGRTVHDAACSSGTQGISRHIVRSVLAYQHHCQAAGQTGLGQPIVAAGDQAAAAQTLPADGAPWDPGEIADEALIAAFRPAAIAKARQRFEQGVLVELTRGVKPTARFLDAPCTLRFLVPGDLRYVSADCEASLLATFVPLAVWAFRRLPAGQPSGLVAFQAAALDVPGELLAELDALLAELGVSGFSGCTGTWPQRLLRLEASLRKAGLVWPAELLIDLHEQCTAYQGHDARFDPLEATLLIGELLARTRAIRNGTTTIPQLLIRGSASDRTTDIAGGRLIGLGLGMRLGRRTVTLSAYLQDADTGSLAAVERTFADPPTDSAEPPKSFADLAGYVIARGVSLSQLSQSQLLLKSGKRTPSGRLVLPRTATSFTVNPQAFAWEQLKPPAAVEGFAQLAARLAALPPGYLRPRNVTENLYVSPVQSAAEVSFNESRQRLEAVLRDPAGGQALLVQPYHSRSREGFESLFSALTTSAGELRFVCGRASASGGGLTIQPLLLVFQQGTRRFGVQPYAPTAAAEQPKTGEKDRPDERPAEPLQSFINQLQFELSEIFLSGLRRWDRRQASAWRELETLGRQLGFVRLIQPIERFRQLTAAKAEALRWDPQPACRAALDLCLQARVAVDLLGD